MKLLFDQNISPKIIKKLQSSFENLQQVRYLGLEDSSDFQIFQFAKENNYTIVTFDSDFIDLNILYGIPPRIIWLRTKNQTTNFLVGLLEESKLAIIEFISNEESKKGVLEIYRKDIF